MTFITPPLYFFLTLNLASSSLILVRGHSRGLVDQKPTHLTLVIMLGEIAHTLSPSTQSEVYVHYTDSFLKTSHIIVFSFPFSFSIRSHHSSCMLCKLYEKLVRKVVVKHLKNNELLGRRIIYLII